MELRNKYIFDFEIKDKNQNGDHSNKIKSNAEIIIQLTEN